MRRKGRFWIPAALLFSASLLNAQDKGATKQTANLAASPRIQAEYKAASDDPSYLIGPQDVLDINVWKEPDISRSVPVRPDGRISLPLVNDVQAAGLTPSQLGSQITAGLKRFMADPQVTVIVSQINSQRVYILGEVARPGAFALLPEMTILQALSDAGGVTPFAHTKKVYLLRQSGAKEEKFPFNYKDVISGKNSEQNLLLKAGDTIVVP